MALFRYFKKERGNLPDNGAAGVYGGVVYTARPRNSLNSDFHENFAPRKMPAIRYMFHRHYTRVYFQLMRKRLIILRF